MPKNAEYECNFCNFICIKKSNYKLHLLTRKHHISVNKALLETNGNDMEIIKNATPSLQLFICDHCNKQYKTRSGQWKHSQKCKSAELILENTLESSSLIEGDKLNITAETIIELVKQNCELQNLLVIQNGKILEQNDKLVELSGKVTTMSQTNNITNNNNNTQNNSFNLNFFLNETCKDAMNLNDFIANVDIQLIELENVGKNGYVTGITDIILSRLNNMEVSKRPIHCTDLKRETMYVRDENQWNKDADNKKTRNMITSVAKKNYNKIPEWMEQNPECEDMENQKYDFCFYMMRHAIGEMGEEQVKIDEKVLRNVAKEVIINKTAIKA